MNIAGSEKIDNEAELIAEKAQQAEAAAQFDALDGKPEAGQGGAEEGEALAFDMTPEEAVAGIIELLLIPAQVQGMQRVLNIWTPATIKEVSISAVKVLKKSTWGRKILDFLCKGFGVEEMALLFLLGPLLKQTIGAVQADMMDIRARELSPEQAQEVKP